MAFILRQKTDPARRAQMLSNLLKMTSGARADVKRIILASPLGFTEQEVDAAISTMLASNELEEIEVTTREEGATK